MNRAEEILDQVRGIPALPDTVIKLIHVVNDPRTTVNDIVEIIKYDQAIIAQMLRICNSAFFGLSREVNSLYDAIRLLGTMKVLQLVMAVHSNALLSRKQVGYGLPPGALWSHSVGVALAAQGFAQRIGLENDSLAFTAGLLHDIGKVILNQYVADEFLEIVRLVKEQKNSFCEAEKQVLGFSHEQIGAKLAEKWKLPDPIIRCIKYHHDPKEIKPSDKLVDCIYLANCVCLLLGVGLGSDGLCYRADSAVVERYELKESDLEVIGAHMLTELKRVKDIFADTSEAEAIGEPAKR